MAEPITVESRPGVTPPPAESPAPEGGVDLPEELLKIPAFMAVTAGQPAAFSALLTDFEKLPEAKIVAANKDNLIKAGYGLYRSMDGNFGVIFNNLFASPEDIQAADAAGTLQEIAPPFAELNAAIGASGSANPVLQENERPTGFATSRAAPSPAAPPAVSAPSRSGLPAGAQKTLASRRAQNLQPSSPTAGAGAGQGELLRAIMKPVL